MSPTASAASGGGVAEVYHLITTPTAMNDISPNGEWAVGDAQGMLFHLSGGAISSQTAFPEGFAGFAVNDLGVVAGSDHGRPAILDSGSVYIPTAPATFPKGQPVPANPPGYYQAINDAGLAVGHYGAVRAIAGGAASWSFLSYTPASEEEQKNCGTNEEVEGKLEFRPEPCEAVSAVGVNAGGTIVGPTHSWVAI